MKEAMPRHDAYTNSEVIALDLQHVFHSWSAQGNLAPLAIAGGRGCVVWDYEGKEYLDFSSQLVNVNIGHQHPKVIEAIKQQADQLATVAPTHANLARGQAAQRILRKAGDMYGGVFFTSGGADANENAMRLARLCTGRDKVLTTYRSYHGNTGSAIAATGDWRRLPNEYARGHVHFFGPFAYRSEFWSDSPAQEGARALQHLERVIQGEGPSRIAAIMLEPVPGTAGIIVPPPGYLAGVRELCTRHGIVLIADEVMCGFGRTGEWFAHQPHHMAPDLITFAKGVNSGYVPVGGVVISREIAQNFQSTVFPGGLTYSGHPLAAASIVAAIDAMESEGIVENAHQIGADYLGPGLHALARQHEVIGDVRGAGVFWALELVSDRRTRAPMEAGFMSRLKSELLQRGLLGFVVENRVHVVPPCVVTPAEVQQGLRMLDEALTALRP